MKYLRSNRAWLVLACSLQFALAAPLPLPNAWRIEHNTTADTSTLVYTNQLTAGQRFASTNSGFRFSVNARFVDDSLDGETMAMVYGLGARRFLIWWDLDTNNNLTARLEGGPTYTLTTNGADNGAYHTHEIIFTNGAASYVFDGVVKTNNWPGAAVASPDGRIT